MGVMAAVMVAAVGIRMPFYPYRKYGADWNHWVGEVVLSAHS